MSESPNTTQQPGDDFREHNGRCSTVYAVLPPDLRRQVHRAIVDHDPPTYRGIYEKFKLADTGLDFHAFYRHARLLRSQVETLQLAELALPDQTEVARALPQLLGQKLVDALLSKEATSGAICRLADAYRKAAASGLPSEQPAAALPRPDKYVKEKELDDLEQMVKSFVAAAEAGSKASATLGGLSAGGIADAPDAVPADGE
jgi:hypothetical protein